MRLTRTEYRGECRIMDTKPNSVKRITQRHQAMFDQWEQERKDFVALHGQAA